MQILGLTIHRAKKAPPAQQLAPLSPARGLFGLIRESFTGAWQHNVEIRLDSVLTYFAVYACLTLIAADIAKLTLRLVEQDDNEIWTPTESPSFSPVLRRPNRFQIITKFIEQWIVSKLSQGNTYVLKQRDNRRIVTALYVLDPTKVTPLVTPGGDVYYQLQRDDLSQIPDSKDPFIVPASEIIHDLMVPLFHPLIGVTPIYACGLAAMQGLSIQSNSNKFFSTGSKPGGVLTAPGAIEQATADRLKAYWEANFSGDNVGKVAVLGDGLKYEAMSVNAVDSQLIEQLKWSAENVCSCFHVPAYMIGVGPPPPYANIEPLLQQYYSQCIQSLLTNLEKCLDEGLGIDVKVDGKQYGTEFDIDDLIWMDTATKTKAAGDSIGSAAMTPDEARKKYLGLGPIPGGASAYMQQQNYSLEALAKRDAADPFAKPAPAPTPEPAPPAPDAPPDDPDDPGYPYESHTAAALFGSSLRKHLDELTRAA